MQRRLTIALVGIALAAVILVGAGVLLLAQIGARANTEAEVEERLDAVAALLDRPNRLADVGPLGGRGNRFGLTDLDFITIDAEGAVRRLELEFEEGRRPRPTVDPTVLARLEPEELDAFLTTDAVLLGEGPGRSDDIVIGLRRIDVVNADGTTPAVSVGLIARQEVVTIANRARVWFLVSTVAVLALAAVAAALLGRRLIRPIKEIEQATASVAAGDFSVRVAADGDDELGDLGRSVNRMAADLERSKALDQQFLLSVSHDLRTPLTAIAGYAEALTDGTMTDAANAGDIIGHHADRLNRLVGDLLDLAKLDANRFTLDLAAVDLGVAAGRVVAGLEPQAAQHGLTLHFDHDPTERLTVEADPDRLAQVMANVVENAIKYAETTIRVGVRAEAPAGSPDPAEAPTGAGGRPPQGWAVVEVADDGPGIDPADLAHVFERLYTGRTQPVRAENASGMGLAIVRELLGAMGGTVTAGAAPSGGTLITVQLPLAAAPGRPDPAWDQTQPAP